MSVNPDSPAGVALPSPVPTNTPSAAIAKRIFDLLLDAGIPVMGIAPSKGMELAAEGYRPSDLLPGAQSMVCFGAPVPQSVYESDRHAVELVWRTQSLLYRRLDSLSVRLAETLEAYGKKAIPIFGCAPMDVTERGFVIGFVNQIRMAAQAGIGIIGRNGLLLHRPYGSRLMLGGLITTAALPHVRLPDAEQPACPPECRACIEACPVGAISRTTGRVNVMRCLSYTARTPMLSRLRFGILTRIRPAAAARLMNTRTFDEHTLHVCSRCVAVCRYGEA